MSPQGISTPAVCKGRGESRLLVLRRPRKKNMRERIAYYLEGLFESGTDVQGGARADPPALPSDLSSEHGVENTATPPSCRIAEFRQQTW